MRYFCHSFVLRFACTAGTFAATNWRHSRRRATSHRLRICPNWKSCEYEASGAGHATRRFTRSCHANMSRSTSNRDCHARLVTYVLRRSCEYEASGAWRATRGFMRSCHANMSRSISNQDRHALLVTYVLWRSCECEASGARHATWGFTH